MAVPRPLLAIALAAVSAVALAACGGGDEAVGEIPRSSAEVMLTALADAQAADEADPRDCETIANSASDVANEAAGMPDSPVRQAVITAAENLDDLAKSEECGPTTTGDQGPENEDTTTTTEPTTTTTTTTEPPEDDDGNGGSGGGGGRGGGGGSGNNGGGNNGGGGPPPQSPGEGGGGLGGGDTGGQPPSGGTGPG